MAVLLLRRRWKVLASFTVTAAMLVLLSLALVGWQGMQDYPRFL